MLLPPVAETSMPVRPTRLAKHPTVPSGTRTVGIPVVQFGLYDALERVRKAGLRPDVAVSRGFPRFIFGASLAGWIGTWPLPADAPLGSAGGCAAGGLAAVSPEDGAVESSHPMARSETVSSGTSACASFEWTDDMGHLLEG
jgi:hypothetical protein